MARGKTIEIEGLGKLNKKLTELPRVVKRGAARAVEGETLETRDDVKRGAPVKTGELRDSTQAEYDDATITGTVAVTARYATFVEHGTDDTAAQPFVEPAANVTRRRFPKRVRIEIKTELGAL